MEDNKKIDTYDYLHLPENRKKIFIFRWHHFYMSDLTYEKISLRFYLTKIWIFWFMISLGSSQRSSKRASVLELSTASFFIYCFVSPLILTCQIKPMSKPDWGFIWQKSEFSDFLPLRAVDNDPESSQGCWNYAPHYFW